MRLKWVAFVLAGAAAVLCWWITQPATAVASVLPAAGRAVASSPRAAPPAPSGRRTARSLSAPPTAPLSPPERTGGAAPPPPAGPQRRVQPPRAPLPPTPAAAGPPREKELRLPRHPPEECLAAELGPPAPPQSRAAGLLAQEAGAAGVPALPRGMAAPSERRAAASAPGRRRGNDTAGAARRPSYDLVILILSSRKAELSPEKRRAAVRRAWLRGAAELGAPEGAVGWGAPPRCAVRHLFVIGGARRERLGGAGDLLMLPVDDGYRSLSHKVLGGLRWSARHLSFKYLFKTDDDSFVCLGRLLELLRPLPRAGLYLGYQNKNHSIVTKASVDKTRGRYAQWEDEAYVRVFGGAAYAPYMQGAGYVLSYDLVALASRRASELPEIPPMEDALVGALVGPNASTALHKPSAVRFRNRDDYALQVCESDTEFVLVHKLSLDELAGCRKATVHRRSARCPRGPCECRSLGVTPKLKRKVLPPPRGGAAAGASKGRRLLQLGRGPAQRGRVGPPLDGGR